MKPSPFSPKTDGDRGCHVPFFQQIISETKRIMAHGRKIGECIERPGWQVFHRDTLDPINTFHDDVPSFLVKPQHGRVFLRASQRGERGFLRHGRGADHEVRVDLVHGLHEGRRRDEISELIGVAGPGYSNISSISVADFESGRYLLKIEGNSPDQENEALVCVENTCHDVCLHRDTNDRTFLEA